MQILTQSKMKLIKTETACEDQQTSPTNMQKSPKHMEIIKRFKNL